MNVIQRVAKNTLALFIGQFVVSLLGTIVSIYVARKLGDVSFGKYTFAVAFVGIFVIFSNWGYDTLLIREIARNKTRAQMYLNNILTLRLIIIPIIFVFIVIFINLLNYPADTKNIVYLFGIAGLITSLAAVFEATFRSYEQMEYEAIIVIVSKFIGYSIAAFYLYLGYGLVEFAAVMVFASILEFALSAMVCARKFHKPHLGLDRAFLRYMMVAAVPLGMLSLFGLIYVRIDTVMLSLMKGDAVVGWYNAAYNLILGFKPFYQYFANALFPIISFYFVSSKDSLVFVYQKAIKLLYIFSLPMAVGITILADKFILLIYGPEFVNAVPALQILAWDVFLIFIYGFLGFMLIAIDKQKLMVIGAGSSAVINIVLNLLLIPSYSYVGSAVATIITETILLLQYYYYLSSNFHPLPVLSIGIPPLLAAIVMGIFVYIFRDLNIFLVIVVGAAIYFLCVYLFRGMTPEDVEIIKKLVHRG